MYKLEIKLKQHTPLIHFQHDQEGATLRASEVKPKLDKYILTQLGGGDYEKGRAEAKAKGWLVGKGDHPALDYKIRIEAQERLEEVKLNVNINPKGKYYTYYINSQGKEDAFPFLLANMGGKDSENELMNLSQYRNNLLRIYTAFDGLFNQICNDIEIFFALNNFGQRKTKGFGSFSVAEKKVNNEEWEIIKWKDNFKRYYENGTPVFKFPLRASDSAFGKQIMLFSVIDFYWRCLKSGINYTRRVVPNNGFGDVSIRYKERYIKAFLWTYLNSKGYTWEKRKLKLDFHLETSYPERQFADNDKDVLFARGVMGCPDKYEYRIPQNSFFLKNNKYKEEIKTHTISISNSEIERIASPIIFKPIIDGGNTTVYVIFDHFLINRLKDLSQNCRLFKFKEGSHEVTIPIPECIDYKELIQRYHFFLFSNSEFLQSTLGNYDRNNWQAAKIALTKDQNGKIVSRKWGSVDISWRMVPRNFSWENILDPKDNGQNKYVSFSQVIRKD